MEVEDLRPEGPRWIQVMPQSHSKIVIHLVFSTRHRAPVISKEIQPELSYYMTGIIAGMGCQPIQVVGAADHIHILFALSRTETIAHVVEQIKTSSSKWIKTLSPAFAQFHWQSGYSAFSVSQSAIKDVIVYIQNQQEHHKKMTFQDEYRKLLQRYEIEYDEKYMWD